jgi:hypothetical protein
MLTLAIPVLNLCLLGLAAIVLPFQVPEHRHKVAAIVLPTTVVALIAGWLFHRKCRLVPPNGWPWLLFGPLIVALGVAGLFVFWLKAGNRYWLYSSLAFCWWLVLGVLLCWAMRRYNRRRTGAFMAGIIGTIVTCAFYAVELFSYRNTGTQPPGNGILAAACESALWV